MVALLNLVPPGKVTTYSSLARILSTHPRAIAKMLSSNRDLIIVPCHRVVMSDGKLGGYRLGKEFKKRVLTLEGVKFCNEDKVCPDSIIRLENELL